MEIKNLSYKSHLKDINYVFTYTKIYGIFVNNQAQATLFLELIAGLIKPSKGKINAKGKKTYMIFSNSEDQLISDTVRNEILSGLDESELALNEICEKLSLPEEMLDRKISELSSNEKRLVVIASMLAYNPDIILIDNFLGQLDYQSQKLVVSILKRLQFDAHKQLIITDQNVDLLFELIDIAIILEDEIVLSANKYEIFKNKDLLKNTNIELPNYIKFSDFVLNVKNKELGYRDRITDIIKDVYDNVEKPLL